MKTDPHPQITVDAVISKILPNSTVKEIRDWAFLIIIWGAIVYFAEPEWAFGRSYEQIFHFLLGYCFFIMTFHHITQPFWTVSWVWIKRMFYAKRIGYHDYHEIINCREGSNARRNFYDANFAKWQFGRTLLRWRYRTGMRKAAKIGFESALWLRGVEDKPK